MSQPRTPRADHSRPNAIARGAGALSRRKKVCFAIATALLVMVFAEAVLAVALRLVDGQWPYTRPRAADYLLFEPHPDWVLTPRRDVTIAVAEPKPHIIHHNSDGFRGREFSQVKTKYRIGCLGGSTTYCVGVSDDQTWVFCLEELLRPDCEVFNFGIPGHSSVEHKKLLPQILARYAPDLIIFQIGLNDLRNMNVAELGPDYQNFHQPTLHFNAVGTLWRERLPQLALFQAPAVLLKRLGVVPNSPFPHGAPTGQVSAAVDPRVVEIFNTNLDILLRECRAKGVRVVLLPHALSPDVITDSNYQWWAPYLTKQGIFNAIGALNAVLRRKADGDAVIYASFMDDTSWFPEEFCDPSHLNAEGNLRLALLLQENLPWKRLLGKDQRAAK